MLWSDQAIGEGFRSRWIGNLDPAATLIAFAEVKAAEPAGWRLAAAATTWSDVTALMTAAQRWGGTEWATCSGMSMPASIGKKRDAIATANTPHRLEREYPDLFERVAQLRARGLPSEPPNWSRKQSFPTRALRSSPTVAPPEFRRTSTRYGRLQLTAE